MSADVPSHTITFSEYPVGTVNPVYAYPDNTVDVLGEIVVDGAQPATPASAANTSYTGPVFIDFATPVTHVEFDAGYFDDLQSTTITFIGPGGNVLQSSLNTQYGIVHYSLDNAGGISAVNVVNTGFDASGFSVDTVTFSGPVSAPANVDIVDIAPADEEEPPNDPVYTFHVTRSGDLSAAASVGYAVTGTGTNPLLATDLPNGNFPVGQVSFAAGQASQTVTVNVNGGFVAANPKTFAVTLLAPSAGAAIGQYSAVQATTLNPPTISHTVAGQQTADTAAIDPFAGVTIGDPNANQTETVTVTLSSPANGALSSLSGGAYDAISGIYSTTGTAAAVTAALDGLVFTPTAGQAAAGQTVTTGFAIEVVDTATAFKADTITSVVAAATGTGTPVVQSLSISGTAAGQAASDQATVTPFAGVTVADAAPGLTETLSVTLSAAANGTLSNLGGGSYNAATGVYAISGSVATIDAALDGLVFTPTTGQVAAGQSVTTSFTITDSNGNGASLNDSTTSVVATAAAPAGSAQPAAPVFSTPSEITNAPAITLSGVAAAGGAVTVTTGSGANYTAQADAATGAFSVSASLALGANSFSSSVATPAGTSSISSPVSIFDLPAPVSGVSTADFSSADLGGALSRGATMQFIGGTESIVLTDGVLSVGPDTNEAAVQRLYVGLLGRTNSDQALAGFLDQTLAAGHSQSDVAADILGGGEYAALHPAALSDSQYVATLYQNLLGRGVETSFWANQLAADASRANVAVEIANSAEAKTDLASATANIFARDANGTLIHEIYETGLGRDVDLSALSGLKTILASFTPAQLVQGLSNTAEFSNLHGAQSNADYVASLYQAALGRGPDAGAASWTSLLATGAGTRASVLLGIATSAEASQHLTANV